jgi:DNA polymerase sigma
MFSAENTVKTYLPYEIKNKSGIEKELPSGNIVEIWQREFNKLMEKDKSIQMKYDLCQQIDLTLSVRWKPSHTLLFGSTLARLSLVTSDLDILVFPLAKKVKTKLY